LEDNVDQKDVKIAEQEEQLQQLEAKLEDAAAAYAEAAVTIQQQEEVQKLLHSENLDLQVSVMREGSIGWAGGEGRKVAGVVLVVAEVGRSSSSH
jgi:hypothetical protein